jgi:hypothetical protein
MKSTRLWAICLMVLLLSATSSFARGKAKKPKPIEFHDTVIESVAADSITIAQDKKSKVYKLNQFTEVTFRGQKATLADLKPGMAVSVTQGMDPLMAARIAANDPPVHNDPNAARKK